MVRKMGTRIPQQAGVLAKAHLVEVPFYEHAYVTVSEL